MHRLVSGSIRRLPSHGTTVAYIALFFALCGTGWATVTTHHARRIFEHSKSPTVRVKCVATRAGRRVACAVINGGSATNGVNGLQGPAGPKGATGSQGIQGPPGAAGAAGAAGSSSLTQAPAYVFTTTSESPACSSNTRAGISSTGTPADDELESWVGQSNCATSSGEAGVAATVDATFSTYLLSPSQLNGSGANLASVQFCYGVGSNTAGSGAQAQTGTMKITQAVVSELDENAAASSGSGAPPYARTTLLSDPLDLTNGSNCQTLTPSTPAAIDSSGYLQLTISATFSATAGYANPNNNYVQSYVAQAPLTLGRITATYSPA